MAEKLKTENWKLVIPIALHVSCSLKLFRQRAPNFLIGMFLKGHSTSAANRKS